MMRLLIKKYTNDALLLFAACALMLFIFAWARVWIVCQFELSKLAPLLDQFKAFERFSPVPFEQFLTYGGSIAMTYHEPVLIVCIVVWCIARGSDVVSGELGKGTLEMLLSRPVSRWRLLFSHGLVSVLGLALLCLTVWVGLFVGIHTNNVKQSIRPTLDLNVPFTPLTLPVPLGPESEISVPLAEQVSATLYVAPTLNLFAFGLFLIGLSSMCSSFDRFRWRTIGLVVGFYIIQFLLFLLSKATDFTGWCEYLTFFSLYQPDGIVQLVRNEPQAEWDIIASVHVPGWGYLLGPFGMSLVLAAFATLFLFIGGWRFQTRDLPAPV